MSEQIRFDRRNFLRLAAGATAAAALPLVSPALGLAALDKGLKVAQETQALMGTYVTVTVLDQSAQRAQDALAQSFQAMTSLVSTFDRHGGDGPVRQFNREGSLRDVPPRLAQVARLAQQVRSLTGGAFDPSVAPLVDAIRASFASYHRPPSHQDLAPAMAALGGVELGAQNWRLTKPGAGLTLDGLAKGYIADQGLAALKAAGASHGLINAGGDVAVLGDAGGKPWRVAVADPDRPDQAKAVVEMTSGAMATSGDYEVYFDREKLYHHIVSPFDGQSPHTCRSASVRAQSCALADALSTACFVMSPHDATRFLETTAGTEGYLLTHQKQRYVTSGFFA